MFDVNELLSKKNQALAFKHFELKKDSRGPDGMYLRELKNYWEINQGRLMTEIRQGRYQPGVVSQYELISKTGKRRVISSMNVIDRFIGRLLAQKLRRYLEPLFKANSFAYQQNKGIQTAVAQAVTYMNAGCDVLVEIDLKDYFDTINIEALFLKIGALISDEAVLTLIKRFLYPTVSFEGSMYDKKAGVLQGGSISPILSNLYLNDFDEYLDARGFNWLRFADNIYIYCRNSQEGSAIFQEVTTHLSTHCQVLINKKKSGVFRAIERRVLGYEFFMKAGQVDCRKHHYQPLNNYSQWHASSLEYTDRQYHIVENGILTKKDFSLLFENEDEKYHLPIEVIEQINVYSNVLLTPDAIRVLHQKKIPVIVYNHYGQVMSYLIPESMKKSSQLLLAQCRYYLDEALRLPLAKSFENAQLHNLRANVRYYMKRKPNNVILQDLERQLSKVMVHMDGAKSIEEMMLLEARVRQDYYHGLFNVAIQREDFHFDQRTKRPPRDAINALISFCNTILYSQVLKEVWHLQLDPKIAVVHASNARPYSLHLDFADIFKPIIVDRTIFSLINRRQIDAGQHFSLREGQAVLLNDAGKRLVLKELGDKFHDTIVIKGNTYTYQQLIYQDLLKFKKFLLADKAGLRFKPYKYY